MIQRRTALKRSTKPIKRSALPLKRSPVKRSAPKKRKVSTPEKKLKTKLWELCKRIIRATYGNTCYTCDKADLVGSNWHTGHFIPSAVCGAYLRYDLRNLRPQCYRCNIDLSGNGSIFYRRLVETEGQAYVDELFADKQISIKADKSFLQGKIDEYEAFCLEYDIKPSPKRESIVIHSEDEEEYLPNYY